MDSVELSQPVELEKCVVQKHGRFLHVHKGLIIEMPSLTRRRRNRPDPPHFVHRQRPSSSDRPLC